MNPFICSIIVHTCGEDLFVFGFWFWRARNPIGYFRLYYGLNEVG